jgi:hypothetical protein
VTTIAAISGDPLEAMVGECAYKSDIAYAHPRIWRTIIAITIDTTCETSRAFIPVIAIGRSDTGLGFITHATLGIWHTGIAITEMTTIGATCILPLEAVTGCRTPSRLAAVAFTLADLTFVARATCAAAVTAVLTGLAAPYTIGITGVHHIAIADCIIDLVILAIIGQKFTVAIGHTAAHVATIAVRAMCLVCPTITCTCLAANLGISTSALLSIWHTLVAVTRSVATIGAGDSNIPVVTCGCCHTSLR